MVRIDVDAKVDRIQQSENLLFSQKLSEQQDICHQAGCSEPFFRFGGTGLPLVFPGKILPPSLSEQDDADHLDPSGLPELKEAVASLYDRQYNLPISAERIIIGHGVKGLMFPLFILLSGSVVVPTPGWLGYLPQLRILNKPYYRLYGHHAANYKISTKQLAGLLKGLVKTAHILILNNPGYPTGVLYKRDELEEIADVCRTYNTLVLANESTSLFTYNQSEFVSMGSIYPEGTFVLNSVSFDRESEGYQVGCCIMPEGCSRLVRDQYCKIMATLNYSAPIPSQRAVLEKFLPDSGVDGFLREVRSISRIMTTRLSSLCSEIEGVRATIPEGGFSFMADLNRISGKLQNAGIQSSNDLAPVLIRHPYHIATVSGEMMMAAYNDFFIRFSVNDFDGTPAYAAYHDRPPVTEGEEREFFERYGERMIQGIRMFQKWIQDLN